MTAQRQGNCDNKDGQFPAQTFPTMNCLWLWALTHNSLLYFPSIWHSSQSSLPADWSNFTTSTNKEHIHCHPTLYHLSIYNWNCPQSLYVFTMLFLFWSFQDVFQSHTRTSPLYPTLCLIFTTTYIRQTDWHMQGDTLTSILTDDIKKDFYAINLQYRARTLLCNLPYPSSELAWMLHGCHSACGLIISNIYKIPFGIGILDFSFGP